MKKFLAKLEGTLGAEDAGLVEKICRDLKRETGRRVLFQELVRRL